MNKQYGSKKKKRRAEFFEREAKRKKKRELEKLLDNATLDEIPNIFKYIHELEEKKK